MTSMLLMIIALAAPQLGKPTPIAERAKGAERIVIATVQDTTARYERNEFGDEYIVTRAYLKVEEAVKGSTEPVMLAVEGGTVDGVTMRRSNMPGLAKGERGVFFLTPAGKTGEYKLHLRGQGLLKLDAKGTVRGERLTLADVKRMIQGQQP